MVSRVGEVLIYTFERPELPLLVRVRAFGLSVLAGGDRAPRRLALECL